MGVLCFGSYASIVKDRSTANTNWAFLELVFKSLSSHVNAIDPADQTRLFNSQYEVPKYLRDAAAVIDDLSSLITYFETNVVITIKKPHKTLLDSLVDFINGDSRIDSATKASFLAAANVVNIAPFLAEVFLYAVKQNNKLSFDPLRADFVNTSMEAGADAFIPVDYTEKLSIPNPNSISLFHLDVQNNTFSSLGLRKYLRKNIGRYIYSRAKIDQFKLDGEEESIGLEAAALLKKTLGDSAQIGEQLSDLILYVLLEQKLNAPKIYNKIELAASGNQNALNKGGVHLLTLGGGASYQIVVGKSNIVGDLKNAIDNAFAAIESTTINNEAEIDLLDSSLSLQSFDKSTTDYLRSIIFPQKGKRTASVNNAFGVFLGYSLGLESSQYSNDDYVTAVKSKMVADIKGQLAYINSKITDSLRSHSFYFYVIPFDDADTNKQSIMQTILDGGGS